MNKIRWGIIGLGNIARKFAEGFKNSPNAKLVAVASKNTQKLSHFQYFLSKIHISLLFSLAWKSDLICACEIALIHHMGSWTAGQLH